MISAYHLQKLNPTYCVFPAVTTLPAPARFARRFTLRSITHLTLQLQLSYLTALAIHCKLLAHTHALLPFSSHFFSGQLQSEMAYLTTLLPLPAHQPSQKMPPRMASDAVSDALDINDITTSASSLS